ncbi:MAG: ABC transporter ATP-binding protein [Sphaerobacteraceae bacterium]|nr:MAG: ABC transporter ATP-binding protein [Sphaerobacteraceae bacterium]
MASINTTSQPVTANGHVNLAHSPVQDTVDIGSAAVSITDLHKRYGDLKAVDGLSFQIRPGEIFALLGPNGAGKTTTLEILEGYRSRDGGAVSVLGFDPQREATQLKPLIGVMLQSGGIYPTVTPFELLELLNSFYPNARQPAELLDLVGLTDSASTRYKQLSGGQQRRLALAAAIIGHPKLLFLDEPTSAMDPQARRVTWELIEAQQQQGTTIILTTHSMEEAERLADRVAIIDHGKLLTLEEPSALRRNGGSTVRFSGPASIDPADLAGIPAANEIIAKGSGQFVIETDDPIALLDELTTWARQRGILLDDLRAGHETLEDVFLRLTGHQIRE